MNIGPRSQLPQSSLMPGHNNLSRVVHAVGRDWLWPCRSICKGVLEALAFCHNRGVAHGSLGPGSILLSTFRDQQSRELIVKLDNFGFAQLHRAGVPSEPTPAADPASPAKQQRDRPQSIAVPV